MCGSNGIRKCLGCCSDVITLDKLCIGIFCLLAKPYITGMRSPWQAVLQVKTFACCSGVNMLGNLWAAMFSAGSLSVILLLFVFVFIRDLDRLPAKGYLLALLPRPLTLHSLCFSHYCVMRNSLHPSHAPMKSC